MRHRLYKIAYFISALMLLGALGLGLFWGDKTQGIHRDTPIELPFAVDPHHTVVLLYFGYVGCQNICTPMLEEIATLYHEHTISSNVGLYFVNLSTPALGAQEFASFFHPDFRGIDLHNTPRQALMRACEAYSSDGLIDRDALEHTPYLYLVTRDDMGSFRLKYTYISRPLNATSLRDDITKELP
ncbi:MAG: hypothetical protein KU28_00185 [Sulfurovum sp. PC08-66]|nr:MAG: hypothetical protein KU28_00185 [Sulfurovum sp. PC08-66]